jgi:hypothetical protein
MAPLLAGGFNVVLGEGRGDEGGDDTAALLSGVGGNGAHEMHAAALPTPAQNLGHGRLYELRWADMLQFIG